MSRPLPCGCDPLEGPSKLTRCETARRLRRLRDAVTVEMDRAEDRVVRSQLDRLRHEHVIALAAHLSRDRVEVSS